VPESGKPTVGAEIGTAGATAGAGPWPGYGAAPPAIASSGSAGSAVTGSRADHTHAGVTSVAGTEGMTPTAAGAGAVTLGQTVVAQWVVGRCRVYAIDGVNGIDTNLGYADPASTSAADYAIACAAAGVVAKRTFAGLAAILPRAGAGRTFEIVIAAATYAATLGLGDFLAGLSGYAQNCVVRGTRTDTTAGVTAFDGSAADCAAAGMTTATGMFAAGYNPTGAPTTQVVQCLRVGGAGPAFAAEPALPCGARIRFDAATATAALRNICRQVVKVSGGDTLTLVSTLPAVPAAGDVFYIEEGGVVTSATTILTDNDGSFGQEMIQLVGIKLTGALTLRGGAWAIAGVRATSISAAMCKDFSVLATYTHPVRSSTTQGMMGRSDGATTLTSCRSNTAGLVSVGLLTMTGVISSQATQPMTLGAGINLSSGRQFGIGLGTTTTLAVPLRVIAPGAEAGIALRDGAWNLTQIDLTNMGAKPAILVEGGDSVLELLGTTGVAVITGATGNTDVGLDLTLARGCVIVLDPANMPTVTGTAGDVRVSNGIPGAAFTGGLIVSWAAILAAGGFIDAAGNKFIMGNSLNSFAKASTGARVFGIFTGLIVPDAGGARVSYAANPGRVLPVANETDPMKYPTSLSIKRRLRVCALSGGGAATAYTVTLYKSALGVGAPTATAMTISVPAATAAGTVFTDAAHPILFADTDCVDIRADVAASGDSPSEFSATLEEA
jgi:hypothetical protein